jgi:two-component system, NarL family, invasion response regulator UvrY
MISVAVVDDHPIVREGIRAVLERQGDIDVVGVYEDGHVFLHHARRAAHLDVVLLDITMPTSDGLDVLERLLTWPNPPRVLMLSMHPERSHAHRAMAAGAHGYLTKNIDDATLVQAVRTVAWGGIYLSPDAHSMLLLPGGHEPTNPLHALSDQERRVFTLLRQGLTVKEIARDLEIARKTVTTYKTRLMQKLGARSIVDIFRFGDAPAEHVLSPGALEQPPTPEARRGSVR